MDTHYLMSDESMLDICYLINSLGTGGAERLLVNIVEHAPSDEATFTVAFLERDAELAEPLRAAGAEVVGLDGSFKFDPRAAKRLSDLLRNREFDILHTHHPYSQSVGRTVGTVSGSPVLVSTHHNVPSELHPVTRTLELVTRPLDAATVAVSEGVEHAFTDDSNQYDGDLRGKWCTIHNGIDVVRFRRAVSAARAGGIEADLDLSDGPVFLNVGRYVDAKAQGDLVEAMGLIKDNLPEGELLIVGWGEREEELRTAVERRGLESSVTVTGKVPTIHEYYALADVFVSSSIREGLPTTHLEAMAARLPIITTDIPGARETVSDGETGIIVPPRRPDRLAAAMRRLADEEQRDRFGTAGYHRAQERFSIERTVEDHLRLYRELTHNRDAD
jgi:glycosyltransferase involved in cell wall biosynthesis